MFKLLYVNLIRHPQLGEVEISFVKNSEIGNTQKPFTSVIIGSNGTGKSFILRTIIEIIRQFYELKENIKKGVNLPYHFQLGYQLNNDVFEIITRRYSIADKRGLKREYIYFKNKPSKVEIYDDSDEKNFSWELDTGYEIDISKLEFPSRVLASSVFLNDRFPFADSQENDFYQYLGVRRTASLTSTKTFERKTVKYLYEASFSANFKNSLAEILMFLGFEKELTVRYDTRYNSLFFNGDLTIETLGTFYERWWELKDKGVNRNENNAPWGQYHYKALLRDNPGRLLQIVDFLNTSSKNVNRIRHKQHSKSKLFIVDFFTSEYNRQDLSIIEDLEKLSILTLDQVKILKKSVEISIEEASSGEYHLILNFLGIFAKIEQGALILIDEPEISLHPNWQMRYISFLKDIFLKFNFCHFIICTHSHFLVSDLEGISSSVISLTRNEKKLNAELLDSNTYGWSAEEVLYTVFNVKTTRNFYLEADLRELLYKISVKSNDFDRMERIVEDLKKLKLSDNDPLNIIINKAEEYLLK